jgi:hypothetical protein
MGIPLLAGRDFTASDRSGRPEVAIVNETLARLFWPGEPAIGKRMRAWDGRASFGPWVEVVGLARDSKYVTVGESPRPFMYRPIGQEYVPTGTLLVKTAADPLAIVPSLRAA